MVAPTTALQASKAFYADLISSIRAMQPIASKSVSPLPGVILILEGYFAMLVGKLRAFSGRCMISDFQHDKQANWWACFFSNVALSLLQGVSSVLAAVKDSKFIVPWFNREGYPTLVACHPVVWLVLVTSLYVILRSVFKNLRASLPSMVYALCTIISRPFTTLYRGVSSRLEPAQASPDHVPDRYLQHIVHTATASGLEPGVHVAGQRKRVNAWILSF